MALLVERGPDAFTLAEVCTRADASMGAIYNRVNGKDDLIRLIHEREMARIDSDTAKALQTTDLQGAQLRDAVAELIDAVTVLLRRDADVLRPFMLLAATDQQISIRGRQSAAVMTSLFGELLSRALRARSVIPTRWPPSTGVSPSCTALLPGGSGWAAPWRAA